MSVLAAALAWAGGCDTGIANGDGIAPDPNTPTYVGSQACAACHPSFYDLQSRHGHSQALKMTQGVPPTYPPQNEYAGVPDPPPGFAFTDFPFVVGGYVHGANFVNTQGYLLIDNAIDEPVTHQQEMPANGTLAGYVPYNPMDLLDEPFAFDCFRCHTTGAASFETNGGMRQGNRPGIGGTWAEDAVQCEACHGPGSVHVPNPTAGNITIDSSNNSCDACHVGQGGGPVAIEWDGYLAGDQQSLELDTSPHSTFQCIVCHQPHASLVTDYDTAVRNDCQICHTDQNMALHQGRIFVRGDYVEQLSCVSCHMPLASKNASSAAPGFLATGGRAGDTRTHIFNIDTLERDYTAMFNNGDLVTDQDGQAAVTVDFVCLRCHDGQGSAFALGLDGASTIADGIHDEP